MPHALIRVDRGDGEPLYRQIRRAIEQAIATGMFVPAERLPSSRELAGELGVSRNTINLAYQELLADGAIVAEPRRGLFVNPDMPRPDAAADTEPGGIDWSARLVQREAPGLPEVEKRPDWHTYPYPFLAGQSDPHAFPTQAWLRSLREALYHPHVFASLQDSIGADDPALVEQIRTHLLPARGIDAAPENILITVGSQQGLDLLGRLLVRAGTRVAVEDPGYLDARHIFRRAGAALVPVPVDERGVRPPASLDGIDLMYVTPSHQHPTNATLPMERRTALLALVAVSGTILIEDDYDSEFRYQGSPSPALKALDRRGHVVYLGTFSKFLSPGIRLGFLVGPRELVAELRAERRYALRHPSGHTQRAMALLIESGDYRRALRRYRRRLSEKWQVTTAAVRAQLPWPQPAYPPGGVSLWVSGPAGLDAGALVERAERRGVLIERGDIFFSADPPPRNCFRIGYAAVPARQIPDGIALLGEEARRMLGS